MGQKINQRIFRVDYKKNGWDYIYNYKYNQKYSSYLIQNVLIKQYLNFFFNSFCILLNNLKLIYCKGSLLFNVKFYTLFNLNQNLLIKKAENSRKKQAWFLRFFKFNLYNFYKFLFHKASIFIVEYFKVANLVFLTAPVKEKSAINLRTDYCKLSYIKLKLQLRRYLSTPFFKECFCILLSSIKLQNFSDVLSFYLKLEISKLKKHNFFLTFLKRALIFFVYSPLSKINGIKILIKGRLNGKPRSSHKLIQVGRISAQSFESKICSTKATSFSALGTFGIKIWICEN